MSGELKSFKYKYYEDGYDENGEKIPDIPILYIKVETDRGRATGPAIIDTGFDGGIYPNIPIIRIFRGLKPVKIKRLENPLYGPISCEVYRAKTSIIKIKSKELVDIGYVNVYIPTEPDFISDEVLVGREVLNKIKICLDGSWVEVVEIGSSLIDR